MGRVDIRIIGQEHPDFDFSLRNLFDLGVSVVNSGPSTLSVETQSRDGATRDPRAGRSCSRSTYIEVLPELRDHVAETVLGLRFDRRP
jgi:hypothetical protein